MNRGIHRAIARRGGYFWLPCPLCGNEFGGHEWRDYNGQPSSVRCLNSASTGHGICPDCTAAGEGTPRLDYFKIEVTGDCPHC